MKCVKIDDATLNAIKFAKVLMKRTIDSVPDTRSEMTDELMYHMLTHFRRLVNFIEKVEEADDI